VPQQSSTQEVRSSRKRYTQPPMKNVRSRTRAMKKLWNKFWPWLIVVAIVLLMGLGTYSLLKGSGSQTAALKPTAQVSSAPTSATSNYVAPTLTPTPTRNWQTFQTFTGSDTQTSTQKTKTFTVPADWQMTWACQGQDGADDYLYVAIYNADGTLYNAGAQVTCVAAKQVLGNVEETKSGTIYLSIDANTNWTLNIQSPQ
jgi:hypothetical protein